MEDIGGRKPGWVHLVLVGDADAGHAGMTGFSYDQNGDHEPVSPRDFHVLKLLIELRKAMAAADRKAPWRTCLIRIDRETGEILFDFEHEDADRWTINLANSDERAKELKPARN